MKDHPRGNTPLPTRLVSGVITLVQIFGIIGGWILHDLSRTRVGVNHHVVFRKRQYQQTILSDQALTLYQVLILLILAGLVIHLIRKRQRRMLIAALPLVLLSGVVFLAVTLPMVRDLPAYAYLLLILVIIWILEGIRTAIRWHSIRST